MSQADLTREVARRVFASEFNDATYTFKESDDERAPNYALLPTGDRANRVFAVGTLTETEDVGDESEYWRGRVVDPTGTFFAYAGQYQPEAAAILRDAEPPEYVAVVGKPRTYEPDDGSITVSLRPESITIVDEAIRDRWVVETATRTLDRIEAYQEWESTREDPDGGSTAPTNEYAQLAREHYDSPVENYRQDVIQAVESLDELEATA
ncbi:RPA family protein [Halovivax gelatinilyticus]|uniref:RPA family protein n=1 Tax=Halovivax gelatinilyticus TaxID=2961597 RepID=UPI0020CA2772|nr:DNA-binding protein [Halovivax gelatinilyticus]